MDNGAFRPAQSRFNLRDLLILSRIPGVGPNRLRALVNHFRDPAAVARANAKQLIAVEGIERKTALAIVQFFRGTGPDLAGRYADQQISRLHNVNGRLISIWDAEYPSNLKRIYDPPPFLFVRGTLDERDAWSLAIVGTRAPSPAAVHLAVKFSTELVRLGIPVVSGLARGVDTAAHTAALRAHGRTLAVIGSGVDVIYPPENRGLADRLVEQGAMISEYEMGAKPDAGNFPRRNRIISGISLGTLIVETGIDGGAMITAATALEQNREIFAVPSAVQEKRKSGTNHLIKEGKAILTESVEDILAELAPRLKGFPGDARAPESPPPPDLSLFERKVYDVMGDTPVHIDAIAERSGLTTSDVLVQLLSLEFKSAVRQLPGKMFVRA
jgi:DNA processing protein